MRLKGQPAVGRFIFYILKTLSAPHEPGATFPDQHGFSRANLQREGWAQGLLLFWLPEGGQIQGPCEEALLEQRAPGSVEALLPGHGRPCSLSSHHPFRGMSRLASLALGPHADALFLPFHPQHSCLLTVPRKGHLPCILSFWDFPQ